MKPRLKGLPFPSFASSGIVLWAKQLLRFLVHQLTTGEGALAETFLVMKLEATCGLLLPLLSRFRIILPENKRLPCHGGSNCFVVTPPFKGSKVLPSQRSLPDPHMQAHQTPTVKNCFGDQSA